MTVVEQGSVVARRYRLGRTLGRGGCGTVFEALDLRTQQSVAIKLPNGSQVPTAVEAAFEREGICGRRLRHEGIVRVTDHGKDAKRPFVVMERIEGPSLRGRCGRPMETLSLLRLGVALAQALSAVHRGDVVHADIKPDNVLLAGARAVLVDFGLARIGDACEEEDGTAFGTPSYMSPEQALGNKRLSPESDVYSLGCVLYEMATGRTPFTGTAAEQMWKHVHWTAPRLVATAHGPHPDGLAALLSQMLEKDPLERPGAATVAARLAKIEWDWTWSGAGAAVAPPPGRMTPGRMTGPARSLAAAAG